jgi:hypothetical protein
MSDRVLDSDPVADPRIARGRQRRTGEAMSRLCSSWLHAGADILVGSIDVAGQVAEDLTGSYCDRPPRRSEE